MFGNPWCPKTERRGCGLSVDELATDALVEPLGHRVLNEFLDQVAQKSLAEDDKVIQTRVSQDDPAHRWMAAAA